MDIDIPLPPKGKYKVAIYLLKKIKQIILLN